MREVKLTTFKEIINRADLEDTLHVLVQDADLGLPIRVNDKLCDKKAYLSNSVRTCGKLALRASSHHPH